MSGTILSLPVSVEQIASAIRQMDREDQERLVMLVPELREVASSSSARTVEEARDSVARLQAAALSAAKGQSLSPDAPFLGNLTLGQYQNLSDEDKARLWDEWANADLMDLEERDLAPHALPAG